MEEYLTVQQAAAQKQVAATTIYEAISRGEIPATVIYGRKVLTAAAVAAYQAGSYNGIVRTRKPRGPRKAAERGPSAR